jgi:hypothetical protein
MIQQRSFLIDIHIILIFHHRFRCSVFSDDCFGDVLGRFSGEGSRDGDLFTVDDDFATGEERGEGFDYCVMTSGFAELEGHDFFVDAGEVA